MEEARHSAPVRIKPVTQEAHPKFVGKKDEHLSAV
jgi:hypothetical protein